MFSSFYLNRSGLCAGFILHVISVHGNISIGEEVIDAVSLEAVLGPVECDVVRISSSGTDSLLGNAALDTSVVKPGNWCGVLAVFTVLDTSTDVLSLGVAGAFLGLGLCLIYWTFERTRFENLSFQSIRAM